MASDLGAGGVGLVQVADPRREVENCLCTCEFIQRRLSKKTCCSARALAFGMLPHIRRGTRLGEQCIVGGKSYIAYDVRIGNRVKINSLAYICNAVTVEDGVMIARE